MHRIEMKTPVEAVGERSPIAGTTRGEVERVVSPAETCLEVTHDGVGPMELRQVFRFAGADDDDLVLTTGIGHA